MICEVHGELQAQITELLSQFHDLKMAVLRIVTVAMGAVTGIIGLEAVI